jgi:hypothetical protein
MRRINIALLLGIAACTTALVTACDTGATAGGSPAPATTRSETPPARGTPAASDATGDPTATCGQTDGWSTDQKSADPMSTDALYLVRAGRHDCYDRVVLDVNGSADVGYQVGYVPQVTADGSGKPIPVEGDAALQVVVRAPAQGSDDSGHQPGRILAKTGDYLYTADQLADWDSLRAVRFAGSFEGQSTLAFGVREKLPFQASTQYDETDHVRHVIIDIAHER